MKGPSPCKTCPHIHGNKYDHICHVIDAKTGRSVKAHEIHACHELPTVPCMGHILAPKDSGIIGDTVRFTGHFFNVTTQ